MRQNHSPYIAGKTSVGFYTATHGAPVPGKRLWAVLDDVPLYKNENERFFVIPAPHNTCTLLTSWYRGNIVSPRCTSFGLSKTVWNEKVARPLEDCLYNKEFSGSLLFHFSEGVIVLVEEVNKAT